MSCSLQKSLFVKGRIVYKRIGILFIVLTKKYLTRLFYERNLVSFLFLERVLFYFITAMYDWI